MQIQIQKCKYGIYIYIIIHAINQMGITMLPIYSMPSTKISHFQSDGSSR